MLTNIPAGRAAHLATAPPPREPRPALLEPRLPGKRVVLVDVDEHTGRARYVRDYRAASEILASPDGQRSVQVIDEASWYAQQRQAGAPGAGADTFWPAEMVWVE